MIGCVRIKPGVRFDDPNNPGTPMIAPGGFVLLGAFASAARKLGQDFEITSGTDGEHTGPEDPHKEGKAYDGHSKNFNNKEVVIQLILSLADDSCSPFATSGGWATTYFFGWLEDAGTPNEHFHFQQRHGVEYPPPVPTNAGAVQDASAEG